MTFEENTISKIKQLIDISKNSGIDLEVKSGDLSISIKSSGSNIPSQIIHSGVPYAADSALPLSSTAELKKENSKTLDNEYEIRAKSVGVIYLQPSPDKEKFVKIGTEVKEGDTLLIIESMKVMNSLPSPCNGIVKDIFCDNEQAVEYDELLMIIEKS